MTHSLYKPMQHDQIRLIKFNQKDNHISATFETFPLEGPTPPYYALSYTWSESNSAATKTHIFQIEGSQLAILDTLQPFFHVLGTKSSQNDQVWWWIDSICINLENPVERTQQVQLMGKIYHHAHKVIAWLGDDSGSIDRAIDFIELLNSTIRFNKYSPEEIRSKFQRAEHHQDWEALTDFFQRKWWTRIWTLQEYAIPVDFTFWFGARTVSRSAVEGALMAGDQCTALPFKGSPGWRHGWNRRRVQRLHEQGRQMSLTALAAYSSCFDATDDRDRLYGIRALAMDALILDIDYSLSVEDVYLRFAKSFISYHRSLDIICFASLYTSSCLPSWVPDWRVAAESRVVPLMVSQSVRSHVGNLRPPYAFDEPKNPLLSYSASKKDAVMCQVIGSRLIVRGVVLDTVDGLAVSRKTTCKLVQSSSSQNSSPDSSMSSFASDFLRVVCKTLVLDRKDRFLQTAIPTEQFFTDFIWLCAQLLKTGNPTISENIPREFREWYEGVRSLCVRGHSIENILRDSKEVADITNNASAASARGTNQDEYIMDTFYNRFFDTFVRMSLRLIVTQSGLIGSGPDKAMKGDLVCVLFGCSVPVLLRPRHSGQETTWSFIGECFLDGFMEEADLEQPGVEERQFCIE